MITKKQRNSSRKFAHANRPNHKPHPVTAETLVNAYEFPKSFAQKIVDFAAENSVDLSFRKEWVAGSSKSNWVKQGGTEEGYEGAKTLAENNAALAFVDGKAVFLATRKRKVK